MKNNWAIDTNSHFNLLNWQTTECLEKFRDRIDPGYLWESTVGKINDILAAREKWEIPRPCWKICDRSCWKKCINL